MAERKHAWPKQGEAVLIGKEIERVYDGAAKASGQAKYSNDINTPGTLVAKLLTSPHAHAKITKLDVEAAKKVKGVKAVYVFPSKEAAGAEIRWEGEPIVAVAAERPELAEDGAAGDRDHLRGARSLRRRGRPRNGEGEGGHEGNPSKRERKS